MSERTRERCGVCGKRRVVAELRVYDGWVGTSLCREHAGIDNRLLRRIMATDLGSPKHFALLAVAGGPGDTT